MKKNDKEEKKRKRITNDEMIYEQITILEQKERE